MKKSTLRFWMILVIAAVVSCKPSDDKMRGKLDRKINRAEEKIHKFENKIAGYNQQLALLTDTDTLEAVTAKAVTIKSVEQDYFRKFIDIQGAVTSKENAMISANTGGVIMSVLVTEGQYVTRGQALAVINSDVLQSNIKEVENSLELAQTVYERQKRLWEEQQIGTELQYLQAKNQVESLEKRLATLQVQLSDATVRSIINGEVDEVYAIQGQMAGPGSPIARVVNLSNVQVEAEIPESFLNSFKKGDKVEVEFPSLGVTRTATIRAISQVINPGNRTFRIEVDLPNRDGLLKPNLLATLKLMEYVSKEERIIVPTRLVQDGAHGRYVFTISDNVVNKKWVEIGESYNGKTEVLSGLEPTDTLVDLGYREVLDGEQIEIAESKNPLQ